MPASPTTAQRPTVRSRQGQSPLAHPRRRPRRAGQRDHVFPWVEKHCGGLGRPSGLLPLRRRQPRLQQRHVGRTVQQGRSGPGLEADTGLLLSALALIGFYRLPRLFRDRLRGPASIKHSSDAPSLSDSLRFLSAEGEMAERMRTLDWSATPLGQPEDWPQSLKSALSIALNSTFPTAIYWDPSFTSCTMTRGHRSR